MKSLVCLLVLFVSSVSYGESPAPLSVSQPSEEPIVEDETLSDMEIEQTVLDYDDMLNVRGGFSCIFAMSRTVVLMPFYLEYQKSLFTKNMKGLVSVGVAPGMYQFRYPEKSKAEKTFFLPVGFGLRYDFGLLTSSFEMGSWFTLNKRSSLIFLPTLEFSLGLKFLKEAHAKLGFGAVPGILFSGSFSVSYPLKKW